MVVVFLLLSFLANAQTQAAPATQPMPPVAPAAGASGSPLGLPLPGGLKPPVGMFDQWWKDPAAAGELQLTEAQKKQLDAGALTQQLALIDAGADGLKAMAQLSALLDAEQLDETAYKGQVGDLSAAAARLVQTLGDMAVAPRRILSPEQWKKLVALHAKKPASAACTATSEAKTPRQPRPPGAKP